MHFLSLFSREIGTIFYSLGFFPTQADLQKFTSEVSTASSRSLVLFWKISNGMCKQGSDIVHFSNLQNLLCHYVTVIKSWVTLEALFLLENSKQTPTACSCATRWKMSALDISTGTDSSQPWLKCYWGTSKTVQLYHCIKKFLISVYEKKAEMQIGVKLNQIIYYTMYFSLILKAHMNAFHY